MKYQASPEDAADIFQAVCLELFSELPKLRKSESLRSWLITVTSHKCLHWKRKREPVADGEPDETAAGMPGGDAAVPTNVEDLEREQILREAVALPAAALPGDDPAAVLRDARAAICRSGAAAGPGHRLDRFHPRPLPQAPGAVAAGNELLMDLPFPAARALALLDEPEWWQVQKLRALYGPGAVPLAHARGPEYAFFACDVDGARRSLAVFRPIRALVTYDYAGARSRSTSSASPRPTA